LDLRDDADTIGHLSKLSQKPVTVEEGKKLAADIKAYTYIECSALTQKNLNAVFEDACKAVFADQKKPAAGSGKAAPAKSSKEEKSSKSESKKKPAKGGKNANSGEGGGEGDGCVLQ
jgi:GTPase SAR1 family protein